MAKRAPAAPPPPRFVRHSMRPAWGVGRVTNIYAGLVRVQFEDGISREFRADVLVRVEDADVPPDVLNPPAAAAPAAKTKKTAIKRKAK